MQRARCSLAVHQPLRGSSLDTRLKRALFSASLLGCVGASPAAYAITGPATPGNPFDDAYHVVSIVDEAQKTCTGIALSKSVVLTTAHCAPPGIARRVVAIDSMSVNIRVKSSFVPPNFDATAMREHRATTDLGILLLEFPLPLFAYTPMIAPIPNIGDQVDIIGYGANENGQVSLRSASLQVSVAGTLQIRLVDPTLKGRSVGLGACNGDSGGPALTRLDGKVALVGVVVWSTGPGDKAGCGGLTGVNPAAPSKAWLYDTLLQLEGPAVAANLTTAPVRAIGAGKFDQGSVATSVSLKRDGGIFVVPVQINGALTLDFAVDSGASDVSVPADVFSTLMRTGTVKPADIVGKQSYTLADGSTSQSPTFIIRTLKIGDHVVENVRASVAPSQGMLLLGQSFLERFSSWSIDNRTQSLRLQAR
jgi:clan AA aspartic protease (TIGR02281 family)